METLLTTYLAGTAFLAFPAAYLGGLVISFTSCVYPVAPIAVAFIGAHSGGSRLRGLKLSLVYVLGLSSVYTVLGGLASLTGALFGRVQANPWTNFFLANVCLLMGLSMLEAIPFSWKTPQWIARLQTRGRSKGAVGGFFVGCVSGLIMGPCTSPVLAVLLSYVATRQNVIFGMGLLFVFSLGMGTLLILLGTFSGFLSSLPRPGRWMVRINHFAGWILLAMGEYLLIKAGMLWI